MSVDGPSSTRNPLQNTSETAHPQQPPSSQETTRTLGGAVEGHEQIDNYRILERIGTGGMGEVYRAEQIAPIQRTVALKIIKRGMDTDQVIARFEAERQALALMDHPNIAKVFDAGSTRQGRPYFVMEYVRGERIDKFCDKQRLSTHERLDLFSHLCAGVQHAHQKAIIHRDLKPSNVLVTIQGEKPVPKIIDFGVAKATAQKLTKKTLYTGLGELIGTPEFMSPEQAEMTVANVDTRTDVYSLGVILYFLLVGALPFEPQELRRAGFEGIIRMIREEDPPRPSVKINSLGGRSNEVARARQTLPSRLCRALRGDLDWITMRALEKNPGRRYGSAGELAADVQRYIRHEPVLARPPRISYRTGKFFRRHRVGVSFAAAFSVFLTGFAVTMALLRSTAEKARAEAQARAEELELVTEFQASMLANINAEGMGSALYGDLRDRVRASLEAEGQAPEAIESTLTMFDNTLQRANATDVALKLVDEQVLKRAVNAIEADFSNQPRIQAALLQTLASTYGELGQYPQAIPLQEAALDIRRRVLGDDHPKTLYSIQKMGVLLFEQGKYDEALGYCDEALRRSRRVLGEDDPQTLFSLASMGVLLFYMGEYDEALGYWKETLEGRRRVLGDDDPRTLSSINNMGALLRRMGRFDEALEYYREGLEGRRRVLGDDHPRTLASLNNMGVVLQSMGRYDEAHDYLEQALRGSRRVLGDDHPRTLYALSNLGDVLRLMGRYDEAYECCREAMEKKRNVLGEDHQESLVSIHNMSALLLDQGNYEEALGYCREALEGRRRVLGDEHSETLESICDMGRLLLELGKPEEALKLLMPAETATRQAFSGDNAMRLEAFLTVLARARTATGDFNEAQILLNEAQAILREASNAKTEDRAKLLSYLAELQESWHVAVPGGNHNEEAARWRAQLTVLQTSMQSGTAGN